MSPRATKADLPSKARFIFQGSVIQAASSKGKDDESSATVKVESVLRAPDALTHVVGNNVTVFLAPGEKVAKGDSAVFYTNPAIWGEDISVRSLGHAKPEAATAAARGVAPIRSLHDQRLEEQIQAADLVLTGTVSAVRVPGEETPARLTARTAASVRPHRISEHNPVWREAVIDVHDVHKGNAQKEVVIRFPSSNDVRWRKAPKFEPGQQGVWLLQKKDLAQAPAGAGVRRVAVVTQPSAYTALHPADFQPIDQLESIKTLIRATKSNK